MPPPRSIDDQEQSRSKPTNIKERDSCYSPFGTSAVLDVKDCFLNTPRESLLPALDYWLQDYKQEDNLGRPYSRTLCKPFQYCAPTLIYFITADRVSQTSNPLAFEPARQIVQYVRQYVASSPDLFWPTYTNVRTPTWLSTVRTPMLRGSRETSSAWGCCHWSGALCSW